MLPPIPPSLFEQNPKFKILYNDLKVGRLNEDGSTKVIKKQRAQDELRKKLHTARVERAKTLIVEDALQQAGAPLSRLPEELRQVIEVISAQLSGTLSADDREVVVEDFEFFVERIEQVADAMSRTIADDAGHVATVLAAIDNPTSPPSIPVTTIQSKAQSLRTANSNQHQGVSTRTIQLADLAASTAVLNRELLQASVRILEQSMHGTVSRARQAKAEHMATVARGMEFKLAIISHDANPANPLSTSSEDGVGKAAQQYALHLRRLRDDANASLQASNRKLEEYEGAGRGMEEIARKYAELHVEMSEVQDEITRLKAAD